jgi:hypothetical protein
VDDAYVAGDSFIDFGFENLELYLMRAGETDTALAVASSTSSVENLEHIFAEVPTTQSYEIWVKLIGTELISEVPYALAWWAGVGPSNTSQGDYNGDGNVGPEDYDVWRSTFGSNNTAADGNGSGAVDAADYVVWRNNLPPGAGSGASVPEPSAGLLPCVALGLLGVARRNSK